MKKFVLVCTVLLSGILSLKATHNIAGQITLRCINSQTCQYEVTITTYTNSQSPADRCELLLDWGDGVEQTINRSNGSQTLCQNNAGDGVVLSNYPNTKENTYIACHSYSPGTYTLNVKDPNRVTGIENIPNSVNVPFYLQTTIVVDPNIGCNSTPQLTVIPLDKACMGKCFYHNPGAYDVEGDSLAYSIGPCLDTNGLPIVGYQFPNQVGGGSMSIDPITGDLSWCTPQLAGKYNVVIYIEEWRRLMNGNRVLIGVVLRDMSIDVMENCSNDNPDIPDLPDLCVDAGTLVNFSFTVTDPNNDQVRMEGYGGPFNTLPAATLTPSNSFQPTPLNVAFNWQTTCDRVRLQPWTVTFKATDNDNFVPLVDIESVNITVVSPGPPTLAAVPQGSSMNLAWGQNPCNPATNPVVGYKIYRRQGPSGWNPSQCETGVPASTGFVLIGVVTGLTNLTFTDNNNGAGLIPGVDYCYRVHAYFLDGAESYASPEACNELKRDVPVITNVDVTSTSATTGTMDVRWVNALANGVDFDTTIVPGPYVLKIRRTDNSFVMLPNPATVQVVTANSFYQLPTLFQDVNLNTDGAPYTYRIDFFGDNGNDSIGNSQSASSVFLNTTPSDNQVLLTWQSTTPWTNYEYAIFRFNTVTTAWDSIGLSLGNSYIDDSLVNGVEYCYYVKSHGSYFNAQIPPLLLNRSQEKCAVPVDLTAPCAPVLVVNSDCFISQNQLIWTNPNNMNCGTDDVVTYNIWYTPTMGGTMTVIATVMLSSDTMIVFGNLTSVAGCYAMTAIDTFGNQSVLSNVVCVDNCPEYVLPNVFTPNADGINDMFIPFPYKYIESIDIKIFDRWGVLVFETLDPAINWDGRDKSTGKLCTDGVYYYTCTVNEIRLEGIVPRKLSGFFHLFGKDIRGE
ncbi:MAG TPA: gliding motility-associated C-terminal domain-containing protein [Bacteroidia bacterium]|nr:gliding motility-associated C-terminal domain-containing protein [Bacteroidia bacterium]